MYKYLNFSNNEWNRMTKTNDNKENRIKWNKYIIDIINLRLFYVSCLVSFSFDKITWILWINFYKRKIKYL